MVGIPPNIRPPTKEEISEQADLFHLNLSEEELDDFSTLIKERMGQYERLDELAVTHPSYRYGGRNSDYKPDPGEDPLNAFVTKTEIPGADSGPLDGYEIGLKDNVCLAGVEMTLGSKLFEGFTPDKDATIVTRLLDAGGTITGKLNMEDMADSGSGDISNNGPVLNPYDEAYLAGGSSSGSAAAVGNDNVDVAIGGDQAGSIRIPASWSGIVGLKPTYGLVPYTGIVGLGRTFDHTGPMAQSVEDCALVLDVIAGKDPLDPRQKEVTTEDYGASLENASSDITVGIIKEGFGHEESMPGVDETVREALEEFANAGADITELSVPMHHDGFAVWGGIGTEATAATVDAEGLGYFADGYYDTQLMRAFAQARRAQADDFPPTLKLQLLIGGYMSDAYNSHYYAKAQNLSRELTEAYNEALSDVDILAMPTTPQTAHKHIEDLDRKELVRRGMNMLRNTAPFDATGHPAISVPAGTSEGLPVGLMFIGNMENDAEVLKAAYAYEKEVGWDW